MPTIKCQSCQAEYDVFFPPRPGAMCPFCGNPISGDSGRDPRPEIKDGNRVCSTECPMQDITKGMVRPKSCMETSPGEPCEHEPLPKMERPKEGPMARSRKPTHEKISQPLSHENDKSKRIGQIANEYGHLLIREGDGKYWWCIEGTTPCYWEEIPRFLFYALEKFEEGRSEQETDPGGPHDKPAYRKKPVR